jgi:glutamine amidotransferase
MCRLIAYLGPERSLESLLVTPPYALLRQSYEPRFQRRGRVNADGFGVGWYDFAQRREPARYRRAVPMWSDASFASLAGLVRSGAILASVRNATPPSPVEETSTGPFAAGHWLFAHNGEVEGFVTGARSLLVRGLSEARAAGIQGTADSEVLFALVLDRLDAGASPGEALGDAVSTVLRVAGGRLNMVLTNGTAVAATACGDSLYLWQGADPALGLAVASEPFDDGECWEAVPDGCLVEAPAGGRPVITPMAP